MSLGLCLSILLRWSRVCLGTTGRNPAPTDKRGSGPGGGRRSTGAGRGLWCRSRRGEEPWSVLRDLLVDGFWSGGTVRGDEGWISLLVQGDPFQSGPWGSLEESTQSSTRGTPVPRLPRGSPEEPTQPSTRGHPRPPTPSDVDEPRVLEQPSVEAVRTETVRFSSPGFGSRRLRVDTSQTHVWGVERDVSWTFRRVVGRPYRRRVWALDTTGHGAVGETEPSFRLVFDRVLWDVPPGGYRGTPLTQINGEVDASTLALGKGGTG